MLGQNRTSRKLTTSPDLFGRSWPRRSFGYVIAFAAAFFAASAFPPEARADQSLYLVPYLWGYAFDDPLPRNLDLQYRDSYRAMANGGGSSQSVDGPPTGTDGIQWWADTKISKFNENKTFQMLDGTFTAIRGGGHLPIGERLTVGVGLGYNHGNFQATGAQEITMNGVDLESQIYWAFNPYFWFDVKLRYMHELFENTFAGGSDDYIVNRYGGGAGINAAYPIADAWTFAARTAWYGIWTARNSSASTTGFITPADSGTFSRATLSGKIIRTIGYGALFAEATLGMVTEDTGPLTLDPHALDGKISGGGSIKIGENASFGAEGYFGLGHQNLSEAGGKLLFRVIW